MRATLEFVRECYRRFNADCFAGTLPEVNIRISSSLRSLGSLRHPRRHNPSSDGSDITLSISNRLDLDRAIVEDTVIHEMIHLYIYHFQLKDSSSHGPVFRQMMQAINSRHSRNITVSHHGCADEHHTDRIRKYRIVIISQLDNGCRCVTVCSPKHAVAIHDAAKKAPGLKVLRVIASDSPVFAHYPSSRTPKFYRIDPDALKSAIVGAIAVEIKDGKFTTLPRC